jgi:hypothetical protein
VTSTTDLCRTSQSVAPHAPQVTESDRADPSSGPRRRPVPPSPAGSSRTSTRKRSSTSTSSRILRSSSEADLRGKRIGTPVASVALLRQPRARTVSHLSHIWRAPNHYLRDRIRRTDGDLAAVLADPVLRMSVTDMQTRYLALDPVSTDRMRLPVSVPAQLLGQSQYELTSLLVRSVLVHRAMLRLLTPAAGQRPPRRQLALEPAQAVTRRAGHGGRAEPGRHRSVPTCAGVGLGPDPAALGGLGRQAGAGGSGGVVARRGRL